MNIHRLTLSVALALAVFFIGGSSAYAVGEFTVQFENSPLFSEAHFMPGSTVTRWIKATNNMTSGNAQAAILVSNLSDEDGLASVLDVEVREGATVLYHGTLRQLSDAGITNLSQVPAGAATQYDVSVTFLATAGDEYQSATLGFDIALGLSSDVDEQPQIFTSDGGGGGGSVVWIYPTPTPTPTGGVGGFNPEVTPTPRAPRGGESIGQPGAQNFALGGPGDATPTPADDSNKSNDQVAAAGVILGIDLCSKGGHIMWWVILLVLAVVLLWFGRRRGMMLWFTIAYVVVMTLWAWQLCGFGYAWLPFILGVVIWLLSAPRSPAHIQQ